ncbi:DUF72 domain-containing protein [Rhodohalobacter sp. SW132]|uniref:DUF72 domain-containing protein n=1 Tax=Rhodohalobacter sp. SW132 TaxID=2293433 RepID=UPI000E256C94|nr:DUF72 domain-containing protein [Rhodohalobacter sp. SW132]REL33240.1 DUF72 domain-containing protein [Rhodohalobacter sp. SW132]
MKFGSTDNPEGIDFSLPDDHPGTAGVLSARKKEGIPSVYVGCAKWNRQELKNFYPRGTKDELEYYATQFNAIELNATFYRNFPEEQVQEWYEKTPEDFRFFPKVYQTISHRRWLNNIEGDIEEFFDSIVHFKEKLGTVFLQLRGNFSPKHFGRVKNFFELWPGDVPLAVEFRHTDWFNDPEIAKELYALLEENNAANVIVDTAGRRDLLHMRLTNNEAFIRYVGANHKTDYSRLDDWASRLKTWTDQGLQNIHFFVHQNEEKESPALAAHFIKALNRDIGTDLTLPGNSNGGDQTSLF